MIGAPLLTGLLLLFHPGLEIPRAEWVQRLAAVVDRWIFLHIALFPLFALLGVVVYWMLPARGRISRFSRGALLAYILLYPAFDALVGLGSGTLLQHWNEYTPAEQVVLKSAILHFFFDPSSVAFWVAGAASTMWLFGAVAAAVALWRTKGWRVGLPLLVAGLAMTVDHIPPFGPLAGVMVATAAWQFLVTGRHRGATPAPLALS